MSEGIRIAALAREWIGTPYRHQGSLRGAGCDCLGLVRGVWREIHGREPETVPPYRPDWREEEGRAALIAVAGRHLVKREGAAAVGDVLVFRLRRGAGARHCGILVTPDRFVHAQEEIGVVEAHLSDGWRVRVAGVFGFPPSSR
ncbi:hypothetical protein EMQ25_08915 [Arsenicitalea aurantiaca]|uniref:NlpC/P60 domain-containing protein n=1 Tax=Arsenicitalea aurantiaca TaxID=1783274 RepID=A0A433XA79_9HYPH|nr:NlpC/P60 family protein [Arsenicitalea aurantiaca]RUT30991.1 hypothetical protein EMQ25_08915 [Arsenicitalea aurantiaca]